MSDPVLQFCGRCGASGLRFDGEKAFTCTACGWLFYRNPAAACVAVLRRGSGVLFVRRAREPGIGLLDLPGGFVDAHESAEDALRRELREELEIDLAPSDLRYLGTQPNLYPFAGIVYHTVDLFFEARLPEAPLRVDESEIRAIEILEPDTIPLGEIALPSIREGVRRWVIGGPA